MVKSPNFLVFRFKINDFWIAFISKSRIDHGKSENFGIETLESNFRAPGPKNLKKGQNFNVIISRFDIRLNQIGHEES